MADIFTQVYIKKVYAN